MDIKELARLNYQLQRSLARATKSTRALERLLARRDEDWNLMEGLEIEKDILEKVSLDINKLREEISKALAHHEN